MTRDSQVEHVQTLKQIFNKKPEPPRKVVQNYIMQRYLNRRNTTQGGRRKRIFSQENDVANVDTQSQQIPDIDSNNQDLRSEINQEHTPIMSLRDCQENIRTRLNNLKNLFEQEETNQRQVQQKFEMTAPKVDPNLQQQPQQTKAVEQKDESELYANDGEDVKDDIGTFLRKKIQFLKEKQRQQKNKEQDEEKPRITFKASTLMNILPFYNDQEKQKLETHYRMRKNCQQKDLVMDLNEQEQEKRLRKERKLVERQVAQ